MRLSCVLTELAANHTVFRSKLTGMLMLKRTLGQIYPHICVLCSQICDENRDLCCACQADLIVNLNACQRCAIPLPHSSDSQICGKCLQSPPVYDLSWSAFIYAQPLEWMIQQLKFNGSLSYAHLLAHLMLPYLPVLSSKPDCIIPVPLHVKRLRERGFNQAYELIKPVAKKLDIRIDIKNCLRTKYTESQTGIDAKSRRLNVKNSFKFHNKHNYQYVILFDDVITTGSTINELVSEIKMQGVKRVDVWSLARAEKLHK